MTEKSEHAPLELWAAYETGWGWRPIIRQPNPHLFPREQRYIRADIHEQIKRERDALLEALKDVRDYLDGGRRADICDAESCIEDAIAQIETGRSEGGGND